MSQTDRDDFFSDAERAAQARWGEPGDWPTSRRGRLLLDHIPAEYQARILALGYFFLATADRQGRCDCSFKGGGPDALRILDDRHLAFPDLPGNNAFMSLGNLMENPHVGMLFIDFADGGRLRVNGRAEILEGAAATALFPAATRAVLVTIEQVVPNCALHVPRLMPVPGAQAPN